MRVEVDCARNVTALATKRFQIPTDDQYRRGDSTRTNPDVQLPCVVVSPGPMLSAVCLASSAGEHGSKCRATEDSEEDSDSSDELASQLQNLRFDDEPLVARGPPGGTATRGGNDYQSSMQFSSFSPQTDHIAVNSVRCKRKIFFEPALINLQPVTEPDASFGWTGWDTQQRPFQQATKFRRSGSDPQESDDRSRLTLSGLEEFNLPFDLASHSDIAQYFPEIESKPFSLINGDNNAPLPLHSDLPTLPDFNAWKTLSGGSLLDQLEEIGPPQLNWSVDPCPEVTSQRYHGYDRLPAVSATISDVTSCHSSRADVILSGAAAMNPPSHHFPAAGPSRSCLPSPGCMSVLSPSTDSGFIEVTGSTSSESSTDGLSLSDGYQDLPSDVIFQYVEDKLKELVRHVRIVTLAASNGKRKVTV